MISIMLMMILFSIRPSILSPDGCSNVMISTHTEARNGSKSPIVISILLMMILSPVRPSILSPDGYSNVMVSTHAEARKKAILRYHGVSSILEGKTAKAYGCTNQKPSELNMLH